jgi:(E)-4-hydroxy-3-methyl-but-2-enyl pyrophosphate reductase
MKITVAKTAGFCWGVKRAIDKVMELRNQTSESIQTFGPLIHNPQILEKLGEKGITTQKELEDLSSEYVVVRTHGIPPEERNSIKEKNAKILDTTCPDVAKIHARIKRSVRSGQNVIIAGHDGHPEIKGLMGYAGDMGYLVEKVEDVEGLPDLDNVGLVSQSTFNKADFKAISDAVLERWPEAEIFNTICDATHDRQDEVRELAKDVDVMIVIGGRASSNTKRLAEVGLESGARTFHIETDDEIEETMFTGANNVGVTAGASTPDWIIDRVVKRIADIAESRRHLEEVS